MLTFFKSALTVLIFGALFISCSKDNGTTDTGTGTGGTGTGGSGGSGGTGGGGTTSFPTTRIDISTTGGSSSFDDNGNLLNLDISDIPNELKTQSGGTASVKLVHAESATISKFDSYTWRATFSNYDANDTTKQPYVDVMVVDSVNKKITELRGYIKGKTATLDYIANKIPATMDAATFQSKFVSTTHKVLIPKL